MSDKRRRRRKGSGDSSGEEDDQNSITASDHEYESAAEDSALEESDVELEINSPTEKTTEKTTSDKNELDQVTTVLEEVKIEDNLDDDGVVELHSDKEDILDADIEVEAADEDWNVQDEERGDGDGQEQKDEKVDDDEDRHNPQYIPKKGMFYEHDDRIDSGDEEGAEKAEKETDKPRRVPRSEATEKWGHDKFLERDQIPKSKEELVTAYGYDIRNEDNAPRARRRRRYGRGPNKYDRNWEDEEAYEGRGAPKDSPGTDPNVANNAPAEEQRSHRGGRYERGGGRDSNYRGNDRGGRGGRGARNGNVRVTLNQPVKIDDKEQFPTLDGKPPSDEGRTVQALPEKEHFNNVVRGQRGGGSRGRGGPRGGGFRGRGGSGNMENNSGKPRSDYSANQRLQKEPRPVENVQPGRENKSQHERLENHKGSKGDRSHQDKTKAANPNDSPPSNRKVNLMVSIEGQNKRYSNNRQGPRNSNNPRHQGSRNGRGGDRGDQTDAEPVNGSAASPGQGNFVNAGANFPTNASGPPPAAPFLPAGVAAAGTPTSTSGFLDPATIVNYGPPPPVQFVPIAVPVTVTAPMISMGSGAPHDTLAVLAPPPNAVGLGHPNVTAPDQVLLAAAQAAAANQGYAEVRGGVTYFNPQAQIVPQILPGPGVGKRPKAAIPIVDPSQVVMGTMSPQSSTEDIEEHNTIIDATASEAATILAGNSNT